MDTATLVAVTGLGISLFLLIYPYYVYPTLLKILPKVRQGKKEPLANLTYALLFSARNEESVLPETLARLRHVKAVWPELDIRAYDDASLDSTGALLRAEASILNVIGGSAQRGKAYGINRLLDGCKADVVLFMDANVLVLADDIRRFKDYFADPGIGAVGARLIYTKADDYASTHVSDAYWKLEEKLKSQETRSGSTMGCDGALWGMRRALYPEFDSAQSDDFRPSMQPLFEGLRVVSAPDIRGVEFLSTDGGQEFTRKIRVACGAWHAHCAMRGELSRMGIRNKFKYYSHKWMRWFSALWLAGVFLFSMVLATLFSMLSVFLGLALLGAGLAAFGVRPFAQTAQIALSMLATLLGVLLAMIGRKQEVWSPVRAE